MWIVLIGFNGSGKTALGRRLAPVTGRRFLDLDQAVATASGRSLPEIFTAAGPDGFRDLEAEVLAGQAPEVPLVVATGGGTVERAATRELLGERGLVIWLDAPWPTLRSRLEPVAGSRPSPVWAHLGETGLAALYARRRPLYAANARVRLDTAMVSEAVLVRRLLGLSLRLQSSSVQVAT